VILRLEGFEASVTYRATALTGKLAGFGEITLLGAEESAQTWMALRDVTALADKPGDVWRISIKPGDAPELVARLGEQAQVQIDWGGGLLWALVAQGTDLRARLGTYDGHATLVRADADTLSHIPRFEPEAPAMAALSAALRGKFDPRGLFSPALAEA
jgi:glycolate oxidase FAD binding subunit